MKKDKNSFCSANGMTYREYAIFNEEQRKILIFGIQDLIRQGKLSRADAAIIFEKLADHYIRESPQRLNVWIR